MKRRLIAFGMAVLLILSLMTSCVQTNDDDVPEFDGENAYVVINAHEPFFTDEEKAITESFELYSELDELGRCGVAMACIGKDIMPTEDRKPLYVDPTGWVQATYNGQYLYNRCHLIGHQLTGEDNNKSNLITGTRYMNIEGMLTHEDMVADYIKETGNHVLYRVTPIFKNPYDLLVSGVLMEAWSVEDEGEGICFNVYCYNVQPGVVIDYLTGRSHAVGGSFDEEENVSSRVGTFVLNTSSKKIHKPDCRHATSMNEANREDFTGDVSVRENDGYTACGTCKPFG